MTAILNTLFFFFLKPVMQLWCSVSCHTEKKQHSFLPIGYFLQAQLEDQMVCMYTFVVRLPNINIKLTYFIMIYMDEQLQLHN